MSERRTRQLTAGLGGMALALLMVALVVRQAQAATDCSACLERKARNAETQCAPLKGPGHQYWEYSYCFQQYYNVNHEECYAGPNPPCPGDGSDNGIVKDCSSSECRFVPEEVNEIESPSGEPPCGDYLTDMGGGTICDNACYAQSCGAAADSTTCRDRQLPFPPGTPKLRPSPCYVTCACATS